MQRTGLLRQPSYTAAGASSGGESTSGGGGGGGVPGSAARQRGPLRLHPLTLEFGDPGLDAAYSKHLAESQLAFDSAQVRAPPCRWPGAAAVGDSCDRARAASRRAGPLPQVHRAASPAGQNCQPPPSTPPPGARLPPRNRRAAHGLRRAPRHRQPLLSRRRRAHAALHPHRRRTLRSSPHTRVRAAPALGAARP
jgi:hypothetical protein